MAKPGQQVRHALRGLGQRFVIHRHAFFSLFCGPRLIRTYAQAGAASLAAAHLVSKARPTRELLVRPIACEI
ncbi:hypothetical protein D9M72_320670 [compost metagenome]